MTNCRRCAVIAPFPRSFHHPADAVALSPSNLQHVCCRQGGGSAGTEGAELSELCSAPAPGPINASAFLPLAPGLANAIFKSANLPRRSFTPPSAAIGQGPRRRGLGLAGLTRRVGSRSTKACGGWIRQVWKASIAPGDPSSLRRSLCASGDRRRFKLGANRPFKGDADAEARPGPTSAALTF